MSFVRGRRGLDTMVFVHGFLGHFSRTWGKFPHLLDRDPDLPDLDILLWGYRSSLRPWDPALDDEAARLLTTLRLLVEETASVHLIGHSMGGILIFAGLVGEMVEGRATEPPCGRVQGITLYATPVKGSMVAGVLKLTVGRLYLFGRLVNRQLRQLARGTYVNELIREVLHRVYRPEIGSGDVNSRRRIPIQICVGSRDRVVTYEEAVGIFSEPPPHRLDEDHQSIKLPDTRLDLRYLALKRHLEAHFRDDFAELCQSCLQGPDPQARADFRAKYEENLRTRLERAFGSRAELLQKEMLEALFVLTWKIGARIESRPGEVFDRALVQVKRLYDGA